MKARPVEMPETLRAVDTLADPDYTYAVAKPIHQLMVPYLLNQAAHRSQAPRPG